MFEALLNVETANQQWGSRRRDDGLMYVQAGEERNKICMPTWQRTPHVSARWLPDGCRQGPRMLVPELSHQEMRQAEWEEWA